MVISKVLHVLGILDRHHFNKMASSSTLDDLYQEVFSVLQSKDSNEVVERKCGSSQVWYTARHTKLKIITVQYLTLQLYNLLLLRNSSPL